MRIILIATHVVAALLAGCRIETTAPQTTTAATCSTTANGDVWIYTSMYRHVVDAIEPVLKKELPQVTVHWFQAGSEKVASRLDAELASGGTSCDILITSDPYAYVRYKNEQRLKRYVSPNSLRMPRSFQDEDGAFSALRLSTMVLVHRTGSTPPRSFRELSQPAWKDAVALGDPLTSGTALTWTAVEHQHEGQAFFDQLQANGARPVGGNAAVLQKLESSEANAGVILLENVLAARRKKSPVEVAWPEDGAVIIPGYIAILERSKNPTAAAAVVDVLFTHDVQQIIAAQGDMHSVDPRVAPPEGAPSLEELLKRSRPFGADELKHGVEHADDLKRSFQRTFEK